MAANARLRHSARSRALDMMLPSDFKTDIPLDDLMDFKRDQNRLELLLKSSTICSMYEGRLISSWPP